MSYVKLEESFQGSRKPSAYNNFVSHNMNPFKSTNPTLKFGEISKALGTQWKALSPEQQQVYKNIEPIVKPEVEVIGRHAYTNFLAQNRNSFKSMNPNLNVSEIAKAMGAQWKALSTEEKLVYKNMPQRVKPEVVQIGRQAYGNFLHKNRTDFKSANPTLSSAEIAKALGTQWKSLSTEEKLVYKNMEPRKYEWVYKERVASAYNNFFTETRPAFKLANPTVKKFGEIVRGLGAQWKALSPEQQLVYKNMPPRVKPEVVQIGRQAYGNFLHKNRTDFKSANPTLSSAEIAKALGTQWKSLSTEEKLVYKNMEPRKYEWVYKERVASAYNNFFAETRPAFKLANPTLNFAEIARGLGAQWKALSPEQQLVYKNMPPRVKPEVVRVGRQAFGNFLAQNRPTLKSANPTLTFPEIARTLGAQWKALSLEQQLVFKNMPPIVKPEIVRVGRQAFGNFLAQNRPTLKSADPTLSSAEIARTLGAQWKALSLEEKLKFK